MGSVALSMRRADHRRASWCGYPYWRNAGSGTESPLRWP
jgi:hypothetical protein